MVSAASGLALWGVSALIANETEPWDSPLFWQAFYPLAILMAGVLGFAFPARPWRWAVTFMIMQLPVMLVGGADFGLLPLGLVMLLLLSLPAIGLASAAGWVRLRRF